MQINAINATNNINANQRNSNFKARLISTPLLEEYFIRKTGNPMAYRSNMLAASSALRAMGAPEKDIMVSLSAQAAKAIKSGRMPQEPVAEVSVGKVLSQDLFASTSQKIPLNMTDRSDTLASKILNIARNLL